MEDWIDRVNGFAMWELARREPVFGGTAAVEEARVHEVLIGKEDEDEEEGVEDGDDDEEDGEGEGVEVADADVVPQTAKAEARDVRMEEML